MCGRYGLYSSEGRLIEHFGLASTPSLKARYNIAPGDAAGVVRLPLKHDRPVWDQLRWGLIPSWAKDKQIGDRMINARAETLAQKPSFRDAFKYQRCLVATSLLPTSGGDETCATSATQERGSRLCRTAEKEAKMAQPDLSRA